MGSDLTNAQNSSFSDIATTAMETLSLTTTVWTTTTCVVEGPVQWPVVTIWSSLQPISLASYPDPIMSATGEVLQSLVASKHSMSSKMSASAAQSSVVTTIMSPSSSSDASQSDTVSQEVSASTSDDAPISTSDETTFNPTDGIPFPMAASTIYTTFTTEFLTTFLTTLYPSISYTTQSALSSEESKGTISQIAETNIPKQPDVLVSEKSCATTSEMDYVVTITTTVPAVATSVDSGIQGRGEQPEGTADTVITTASKHHTQDLGSIVYYYSFDKLYFVMCIVGGAVITLLVVQLVWMYYSRRALRNVSYTSKPPRPGLRKRLSVSVTGRRSSNPTEATHVSGHAESIGRATGKGHREMETRRTPITPHFEV